MIRRVYTTDNGDQVLVQTWTHEGDTFQEVAMRAYTGDTWSPPLKLVASNDDAHGLPWTDPS